MERKESICFGHRSCVEESNIWAVVVTGGSLRLAGQSAWWFSKLQAKERLCFKPQDGQCLKNDIWGCLLTPTCACTLVCTHTYTATMLNTCKIGTTNEIAVVAKDWLCVTLLIGIHSLTHPSSITASLLPSPLSFSHSSFPPAFPLFSPSHLVCSPSCLFLFLFVFWVMVLLCSPGWTGTCDPPASPFWITGMIVLCYQAQVLSQWVFFFDFFFNLCIEFWESIC